MNLRFAAVVLLVASACAGGSEETEPLARSPQVSEFDDTASDLKAAHDFTLKTFDGDTFTLSDHFGELPVVLNFWAPW